MLYKVKGGIGLKKLFFFFLTSFWATFIFYNSLQSGQDSAAISGRFVSLFYKIFKWFKISIEIEKLSYCIRKAAHMFEFFLLAVLVFPVFENKKCKYLFVLIFGLIIAVIDETIQMFIPGRMNSLLDIAIDFFGVFIAVLVHLLVCALRNKKNLNIN